MGRKGSELSKMFVLTEGKEKEGRLELKSSSRSSNSRAKTSVSATRRFTANARLGPGGIVNHSDTL